MEQIVGVAQLYFMPHPLLEIVQRLMAVLNCYKSHVKQTNVLQVDSKLMVNRERLLKC